MSNCIIDSSRLTALADTAREKTRTNDQMSPTQINARFATLKPIEADDNDVVFYDYDGYRLYSYTAAEALALTEMPELEAPGDPYLKKSTTGGDWNYTLQEMKDCVNEFGKCNIGAQYETIDGSTYLFFDNKGAEAKTFYVGASGNITVKLDDTILTGTGSNNQDYYISIPSGAHIISIYRTNKTTTANSDYKFSEQSDILNKIYPFKVFFGNDCEYRCDSSAENEIYHSYGAAVMLSPGLSVNSNLAHGTTKAGMGLPAYSNFICFPKNVPVFGVLNAPPRIISIAQGGTIWHQGLKTLENSPANSNGYILSKVIVNYDSGMAENSTEQFMNNKNVKKVSLADSVSYIPNYCFMASELSEFTFTSNITAIGSYAFASSKLKSAIIPTGAIHMYAFNKAPLTTLELGSGVSSLDTSAFSGAALQGKLALPESITIQNTVFNGCTGLTKVFIPSTANITGGSSTNNGPFYNCSSTLELYTDANAKPNGWPQYFDNYSTRNKLTVNYNTTREQFEQL